MSGAPRVGVRLKGQAPNTQGVGAKIKILDGAVAMQSQEVICGGRYLSGDDPMRVFAAGSLTNDMRIEVTWRSGKKSVVERARPNWVHEIAEAGGASERLADASRSTLPRSDAPTLFEDVSGLIAHEHHEKPPTISSGSRFCLIV